MMRWQRLLALGLRMLVRDARAGELRVLVAALVLAAASVGTVAFFSDRVRAALTREANVLLGADVMISGDRALPDTFAETARAQGLRVSPAVKFSSMVLVAGRTGGAAKPAVLADIKAVAAPYPLRGEIRLVDPSAPDGRPTTALPGLGEAWVDTRLAGRLAVEVGDRLDVGESTLTVTAIVAREPEVATGLFALGPRVLMNAGDVPATQLLQPGNRAAYRLYVAEAPDGNALERYMQWARAEIRPGQRLEGVRDLRPEVKQTLERAESFLGLASLVAVMLAAVAVALAASRYLRRHLDTAAMLRCMGARERSVLALFAVQFTVLGLVASGLGVALALLGQEILVRLLVSVAGTLLPAPSLWPGVTALLTGVLLLFGFAFPPLVALAGTPPLRVLRRDLPRPRIWGWLGYLLGAGVIAALVAWQAPDATSGAIMLGGTAGLLLLAALTAWGLLHLLKRLPQRGITWRFGLANLRRRPLASSLQIGALSLGLMALLLLTFVRGELMRNWRASLPPDAPNHFVINVLPDQVDGVRDLLTRASQTSIALYPMIRGRLVAVNDAPLDTARFVQSRARRLAEREFNLSWMSELPATNRIVAGRWWGSDGRGPEAGISMERGIADTLGLKLGDKLTWDIAGNSVSARVTSLRKVDWDSFRPNFFTLFAPGVLEDQPQTYLGAVRLPPGAEGNRALATLVERFPNVLAVDVGELIRQVQTIMDQVAQAVEFVFLFTLVGGLLVLQAAIAATQDERQYDAAILRTLGARSAQLLSAQMGEFVVLGALSGALAAAGATATGYVLADRVFNIPYGFSAAVWVIGILGGAACVAIAGWLGTRATLRAPPLTVLRQFG